MTTDEINCLTNDDIKSGKLHQSLGPHYFSSRRVVEEYMKDFDPGLLRPIVDDFVKEATSKLWDSIHDHLWGDTESNLQSTMWRTIDKIIEGAMSGEKWILDRYALGSRYDCEKVREAVAKHITDEVAKLRIADLEAEVKRLQNDLNFYRNR